MADTGSEQVRGDPLAEFREMFKEQSARQGRLRHVQQFLTSPLFLDLREQPVVVSDPPEAVEERRNDLDYRIKVLQSLLELLTEERAALERTFSAETVAELDAELAAEKAALDSPAKAGAEAAEKAGPGTAEKTAQGPGKKTGSKNGKKAGKRAGAKTGQKAGARPAAKAEPASHPEPEPDPGPGPDDPGQDAAQDVGPPRGQ